MTEIKVMLNAILDRLDVQEAHIEAMRMDLHQLNGRVSGLEEGLERLEAKVNRLDEKVNRLDEKVDHLDKRVMSLEEKVNLQGEKLDALSEDVLLVRRDMRKGIRRFEGILQEFNHELELTIERVEHLESTQST